MSGYGYRLMGFNGFAAVTTSNPDGQQLALAEMDPDPLNIAEGHRNVWVEASLDARREWVEFFGPVHVITRSDSWNIRSNDPHRIKTFPPEVATAGGDGGSTDLTPVLNAIAAIPAAPTEFTITGKADA